MTPSVSIGALIYASPRYARHLWEMLQEVTPELATGEAEFYFVANDAHPDVLDYLREECVPHVVQDNPRLSERELVALGIGAPEYIRRVYQGWNRVVAEARSDCLVLLSSDHVLLPGWLAKLRGRWHPNLALSPLTIEPAGRYGVFDARIGGGTGAVAGEHGSTLDDFDPGAFHRHAASLVRNRVTPGGAHQPVMLSKRAVLDVGGYPEGNLHAGLFHKIAEYGDRRLFRLLAEHGVRHVTYHGTVAYHFQEGEMREAAA